MFCQKCGQQIADGSSFCVQCGARVGDNHVVKQSETGKKNTALSKIALVFTFITSPVALILRFLLEENTRVWKGWNVKSVMMLPTSSKIIVALLAIGMIVFSIACGRKRKLIIPLSIVNTLLTAVIIMFTYAGSNPW